MPDPRVQKYVDALKKANVTSHILCWDRKGKFSNDERMTFFKRQAPYGSGAQNMKGILFFNIFLIKQLYLKRKSYSTIHACDFDTVLPALFMKLLFGKKVIYDIFDWFVDGRHFNNILLKKTILFLEKFALKYSNASIICDERRKSQINFRPSNLLVLPNIPNISFKPKISDKKDNKLHVSYVGTLPSDRGIDKILKSVSRHPEIFLDIAGFGIMSNLVEEYASQYENIHFHGTVSYEKGLQIMSDSDIIIATYEKSCRNNIFAAPNKYYEGLYLGKPILTTEGTIVGDSTKEKNTGFVVGEKQEDYDSFFDHNNLLSESIIKGQNAEQMWNRYYSSYVDKFMTETYLPMIQNSKE